METYLTFTIRSIVLVFKSTLAGNCVSYPRNDLRHNEAARAGELHLQLWHYGTRTSILAPSRLTNGCYEVWNERFHLRFGEYCCLTSAIHNELGIQLPSPAWMDQYMCWFVWASSVGVTQLNVPVLGTTKGWTTPSHNR